MKKTYLLIIFFLFYNILHADYLSNAQVYIDKKDLSLNQIKTKEFKNLDTKHINLGFVRDTTVWLKFFIDKNSNKLLEIDNPLLEKIELYDENFNLLKTTGITYSKNSITASFNLNSLNSSIAYLKVQNSTTSLQFTISLVDKEEFLSKDKKRQFTIILCIGFLGAFVIYALGLYFYTKDKSYILYVAYILALVFQQLTYVGFLPLYMPTSFTYWDNLAVVPKVGLMIIAAIFFARSFLKTVNYRKIDIFYKLLIFISIIQILFLSTPWFYYPEFIVITGLIFIFYNLFVAIYVYKKGNKQARFFIAGWSFVIIGFFFSIIDALGIYSLMYHFPSLVLILTIFEAFFLLLAFVDRLNILQKEKNEINKKLLDELKQRNEIIESEVGLRTKLLKDLYRELHHRVKNNLQIILSIIRLQGTKSSSKDVKEQFVKLETRIKSISKTHEILYLNDDIENIDMYEYIYSLCEDIESSYLKHLNIDIQTEVKMPLKYAVYLGIIINELITNSIKYSDSNDISIKLYFKHYDYFLEVKDGGKGYKKQNVSQKSLGLKLVENLVLLQLDGTIETNLDNVCEYNIRFRI